MSPRGRYSPRVARELQPAGAQTTAHVVSQRSPCSPHSTQAGSLWFPSGTVPRHIPAVPPSHPHPDCSSQGCRGCSFGLADTAHGRSRSLSCPSDGAHGCSAPSPTDWGVICDVTSHPPTATAVYSWVILMVTSHPSYCHRCVLMSYTVTRVCAVYGLLLLMMVLPKPHIWLWSKY